MKRFRFCVNGIAAVSLVIISVAITLSAQQWEQVDWPYKTIKYFTASEKLLAGFNETMFFDTAPSTYPSFPFPPCLVSSDNGKEWNLSRFTVKEGVCVDYSTPRIVAAGGALLVAFNSTYQVGYVDGVSDYHRMNTLFHSIDSGKSWKGYAEYSEDVDSLESGVINTPIPFGEVHELYAKGESFYVLTGSRIFKSDNDSLVWTSVAPALPGKLTVKKLAICHSRFIAGTDSGMYTISDGGTDWSEAATSLISHAAVHALASHGDVVIAGTDSGLIRSIDRGSTWSPVTGEVPESIVITSVTANSEVMLAGNSDGYLFSSSDNGASWTAMQTPFSRTAVDFMAVAGEKIYMGMKGGGIVTSSDNAANWSHVTGPFSESVVVHRLFSLGSPGTLFAATECGFFRSADNGDSWEPFNNGLPRITVPWTYQRFAQNSRAIFVTTADNDIFTMKVADSVWRPLDSDLNDTKIHYMDANENVLIAATPDGCLISEDDGESWVKRNQGLDSGVVQVAAGKSRLFAATLYYIFTSDDGGKTWLKGSHQLYYGVSITEPRLSTIKAAQDRLYLRITRIAGLAAVGYTSSSTMYTDDGSTVTNFTNTSGNTFSGIGAVTYRGAYSFIGTTEVSLLKGSNYVGEFGSSFPSFISWYYPVSDTIQPELITAIALTDSFAVVSVRSLKNSSGIWRNRLPQNLAAEHNLQPPSLSRFEAQIAAPNRTRPQALISFTLPRAGMVNVSVCNLSGRCVATIADALLPAGRHRLLWNSAIASAGTYIININADRHKVSRIVQVLR